MIYGRALQIWELCYQTDDRKKNWSKKHKNNLFIFAINTIVCFDRGSSSYMGADIARNCQKKWNEIQLWKIILLKYIIRNKEKKTFCFIAYDVRICK